MIRDDRCNHPLYPYLCYFFLFSVAVALTFMLTFTLNMAVGHTYMLRIIAFTYSLTNIKRDLKNNSAPIHSVLQLTYHALLALLNVVFRINWVGEWIGSDVVLISRLRNIHFIANS